MKDLLKSSPISRDFHLHFRRWVPLLVAEVALSSNRIAYEIDKAKRRYVAIGITQEQVETGLVESLQSTLHIDEDTQKKRVKFEDASRDSDYPFTSLRDR